MNRLDQFLSVAARSMRVLPAATREDELRELRGHLEQRAEDYENQGMSGDDAQTRALEGLGSARTLGAKLCDAWEGIAFGWWRLAAALAGVSAFLLFATLALIWAIALLPMSAATALLPEIVLLLCAVFIALPLLCGVLFSHWLGRRGCIVATLYFAALALNNLTLIFPAPSIAFAAPPANFVTFVDAAWFPYLWVVLAFVGAWAGQSWRIKQRYKMALAGARLSPPSRVLWMPLNPKWGRNAALAIVIVGVLYTARVWTRFHPRTPKATLYSYLVLHRQMNGGDFEPPKILALRELPAKNPAEIAGTQKRIAFEIEERMTPNYQARRVAYLKQLINAPEREKPFEDRTLRLSLVRLQRNRQITKGVAWLAKTPDGWQIKTTSGPSPGDWAYDLAFQR